MHIFNSYHSEIFGIFNMIIMKINNLKIVFVHCAIRYQVTMLEILSRFSISKLGPNCLVYANLNDILV